MKFWEKMVGIKAIVAFSWRVWSFFYDLINFPLCKPEFTVECSLFVLFYFEILSSFVLILFIKQRRRNFSKFKTQICKTGQNLFSPLWKSVQWLTANFLLDQQEERNKREWCRALYQNIKPRSHHRT